jgi:hypothetical protein
MCYGHERQRLTLMNLKNLLQQNFTKMNTCAQTLMFLFYLSAYTEGCQSIILSCLLVVTLCSAVVGYQCFRGPCCLHFHGESQLHPQDGGSMDL